jgi:hypothetical protein
LRRFQIRPVTCANARMAASPKIMATQFSVKLPMAPWTRSFMPDVKWIEVKATEVRSGAACGDVVSGDPGQPLLLRRTIPLESHLSFKCHLVCFSARMIRRATGPFRVRKYKHTRIGYSILASLSDRRVSRRSRDCSAVSECQLEAVRWSHEK